MSDITIGEYKVVKLIGTGVHASVFSCRSPASHSKVAVKVVSVIDRTPEEVEQMLSVSQKIQSLNHESIVKVKTFVVKDERFEHAICDAMELFPNGSLSDYVKKRGDTPLEEEMIIDVAKQLASALNALHSNGIVHRFVDPQNVLILDVVLHKFVLSGFTYAVPVAKAIDHVGVANFIAPEINGTTPYDGKVDMYSFGATLFYLLSNQYMNFQKLKSGDSWETDVRNDLKFCSEKLLNVVIACCNDDPAKRPSAEQVLDMLK